MTVKETNQIHRRMNRLSELIGTLLVAMTGLRRLLIGDVGALSVGVDSP